MEKQASLARRAGATPDAAARTFAEFIRRHNAPGPGQHALLDYEHTPRLVRVAQRVVDGDLKRVLILLPPRYFKSEIFSRLLPAYYLRCYPTRHVGLASYGATLAWKLSAKAREHFRADGGATRLDTDAKRLWQTADGGEMWAAGIDGEITGSGYHLGIVDDPMKPKHARSQAYVDAFRAFFPDTWHNRQEPGAAIIVVMQRLGQSDPVDFLFRREVGDDVEAAPEAWHVVCCDEIKSLEPLARYDGPMGLPPTCTLEPDPRAEGELLAPSRFGADAVRALQAGAGIYRDAQRQQRPGKPSGDFWQEHYFAEYGTLDGDPVAQLPPGCEGLGTDWDTAYTKDEHNSASARLKSARKRTARKTPDVYVCDVDWRWLETPELVAWMKASEPPHYIEAKASGKSSKQFLDRSGVRASEVQVQGDKYARSGAAKGYAAPDEPDRSPRVFVHASVFRKFLEGERQGLLHVTAERLLAGGPDLDVNDAFTQAVLRHARGGSVYGVSMLDF